MLPVETPFKTYTGLDGKPLDNGYVYFGLPDQDPIAHPITVYWDAAGTLPAAQPLRTANGYIMNAGSPANVFYNGAYSELVKDSKDRQVFYSRSSDEFSIATVVSNFLTNVAAQAGASLIGFIQAGAGAVKRTLESKARESISVFDFLTDDQIASVQANLAALDLYTPLTKAIVAAGTGTLRWPAGTYVSSGSLVQPSGQKWMGEGGQRATTIKKAFNGDLVIVGDKGEIYDINLDGVGATYTGRGFYVAAGFSQRMERCRAQNTKGPSLEYAANAGGGSHVSDFEGNTMDQMTVPAIKLGADTGPSPKFFDGIWLSGGLFDFSAGGNGSSLTNFYIRNFVTSCPAYPSFAGGSGLFHIANGRVASISDTTTISGAEITITGVSFSGPVALYQAQGMKLVGCSYGAGITEDGTTCNSNEFSTGASYTPTWTQASGAQPAIGNGALSAVYRRTGRVCTVSMRLSMGTTTTTGNAAGAYMFSLPYLGTPDIAQRGLYGTIFDASAATDYPVNATVAANDGVFTLGRNGQGVRDGYPIVWAAGDVIDVSFSYMVR